MGFVPKKKRVRQHKQIGWSDNFLFVAFDKIRFTCKKFFATSFQSTHHKNATIVQHLFSQQLRDWIPAIAVQISREFFIYFSKDQFWRKTFLLYLDNLQLVQVLFFGPKWGFRLQWFYLFGLKIQSINNKCRKLSNMKFESSSWPKRSLEKLRSVFAPSFFFIKIMVANWNHSILEGVGTSYGSDLSSVVWKKMLVSLFGKSALFIHWLAKNCLENKWNCQGRRWYFFTWCCYRFFIQFT